MDIFAQILKLIFRIRYWLIFLPLFAAIIVIYQTRNLQREYIVNTTIYTGIASGFTIESGVEGGRIDWGSVNNGLDNLVSIIKSKSTLRNVSIRLYVQHMMHGDTINDNNYILARNFRSLLSITPKEVKALIDKSSEERTIANLNAYEKASPKNFIYGLFNWFHPHYSYTALSNIQVNRLFNSDMLNIQYSSDDPGVAYNTLVILNDEFVKQYEFLRFGETNNVVEYFRSELAKLGLRLRASEDSLTQYNIDKKVINYTEQTREVAAISTDYDLRYNEAMLKYAGSSASVSDIEKKIKDLVEIMGNNTLFIGKLNDLSRYTTDLARLQTFQKDSSVKDSFVADDYKKRIEETENDLKAISKRVAEQKYSKEGIPASTLMEKWIIELINKEQAAAELKVMTDVKKSLDYKYLYFSPIGSTLKRKEREINFTEQSYLSLLQSLNTALMRQKTLQMTSATLKAIDPPLFPISPISTARKAIVIATYFGTIIFIISFFVFLEIFDHTLRDKIRTERLIPAVVLGAFPSKNKFRYRGYNKEHRRIATNFLANAIVPYLNPKERPDIINFISTDGNVGKSDLIENLKDYWVERGLRVRVISWHDDISPDSRDYILSLNLTDLFDYDNEDIIIVEHRSILKSAIPLGLLREASINLLVVRADKVWRDIDKIAFERLKAQTKNATILLYLTQVRQDVAESFMGILPPYTRVRKFVYKVMQLGLTSK